MWKQRGDSWNIIQLESGQYWCFLQMRTSVYWAISWVCCDTLQHTMRQGEYWPVNHGAYGRRVYPSAEGLDRAWANLQAHPQGFIMRLALR